MNVHGEARIDGDDCCAQTCDRRFNAVRHGLTAKTPVLPGEDPAALQALIDDFQTGKETRNKVEENLAKFAAISAWQLERANRLEVTRATRDLAGRSEAEAVRAALEAADLGHRLLFDRRGPAELYPSREYQNKQPRTSSSERPDDPDEPVKLVIRMEATRAGRGWLLKEWGELRKPIDAGSVWHSSQKLKAIRLLGRQPLHSVWDDQVALVFLASHAIKRSFSSAFHELRCEEHEERFKVTKAWLERDEMQAITPASAAEGRAVLLEIVDRAIERLRRLEAERAEVADFVEELDSKIPSDQETKTVAGVQRHSGSCNRLMLKNLDAIDKARRYEAEGWGKTRADRESRKDKARRSKATWYSLLVADEHGTVREADAYDGDIEEGLARYKAKFGQQPYETVLAERQEIDRGSKHVIPDFARWVEGERGPASAGTGMEGHGGGTHADGAANLRSGVEAGEVGSSGAGREEVVASDGHGAAERQAERSDAVHPNEERVDRGDDGFLVRGGRELDVDDLMSGDSLLLTGKEEKANIQNETNGPSVIVDRGQRGSENEVDAEAGCGRSEGGDALDTPRSGRTLGEEDGEDEGKTFGHGDGGDPSGARDPRQAQDDGGDPPGARDPRQTQEDGGGGEETFGHGDGGVRDPRRTEEDGGREEETFGRGDGGVRDPRRTEEDGGSEEQTVGHGDGEVRDPRRTSVGESFGHDEVVASDGPVVAEREGERCDAERRDQGAVQVVPSGVGREQVVASETQPEWRRAQMERMRREWMRMRAAKQDAVREHPGSSEARGP